jgi:glycosyltransferase involved in cell wall biosynthesis
VEKLKSNGRSIDLILVEGVPHSKVKELYDKADLAIDQLLCGWYGVFALEMMALGKPAVCYIREEDLAFIPTSMRTELPIISANPDSIYDVLEKAFNLRNELRLIGEKSRAYVEHWHDPLVVAQRTKEIYDG